MKFLLCGALLGLSVWSHAEGAKVLGFTMDAPAPHGAELTAGGGGFAMHSMQHRLCGSLVAISDELGIFKVTCYPARGVDWEALFRAKYGSPVIEVLGAKFWAADGFAFIGYVEDEAAEWWAPRTGPKLGEHSGMDDLGATLEEVNEKSDIALASIQAAKHADVIAEEDF